MANDEMIIHYETTAPLATIRLDRPRHCNALTSDARRRILDCLKEAEHDDGVSAVALIGTGEYFCAGSDLPEVSERTLRSNLAPMVLELYEALRNHYKPCIGLLNGPCIGAGWEFALGCDLLYAAPTSSFRAPELALAIVPGGGLTRNAKATSLSPVRLKEAFFLQDDILAAEALALGLINGILADEKELREIAHAWSEHFKKLSPMALAAVKRLLNTDSPGLDLAFQAYLLTDPRVRATLSDTAARKTLLDTVKPSETLRDYVRRSKQYRL